MVANTTRQKFTDNSNRAKRAAQLWPILISCAINRQTITYGMLASILGFKGATPLNDILGRITFFCLEHKLPQLSVLVVNKSGLPGAGLAKHVPDFKAERELVFKDKWKWFEIVPPTASELEAAFRTALKKGLVR